MMQILVKELAEHLRLRYIAITLHIILHINTEMVNNTTKPILVALTVLSSIVQVAQRGESSNAR